ncbi:MAG: hypothetical protein U9N41_08290 [Euryarchaeota archaeon]|nr:hypothetical protein [Euryarchaeota archaeon]
MKEVRKALKKAYSHKDKEKKESCFKCFYTGITSKFNPENKVVIDPLEDALVLTIDHENPEDPTSCLVVSLYLINQIKSKLPPDKFKQIVIALGKYFNKEIEQEDFENKFKQLFGVYQKKRSLKRILGLLV